MRNLALEVAGDGVTANSLALGLMNNVPEEALPVLAASIPAGRLGSPDDIAACCVYLASDEAGWMTGQTIQLNGGSVTAIDTAVRQEAELGLPSGSRSHLPIQVTDFPPELTLDRGVSAGRHRERKASQALNGSD